MKKIETFIQEMPPERVWKLTHVHYTAFITHLGMPALNANLGDNFR